MPTGFSFLDRLVLVTIIPPPPKILRLRQNGALELSIVLATKKKNLKLRIAQNQPRKGEPNHDTEDLQNTVGAQ